MTHPLLIERDGTVVILTLNRPEVMNTITDADMVQAIEDVIEDISADQSIRCAILTGAGKAFSSGGNLNHMAEKSGIFGGDAISVKDSYKRGIQRLARAV